MCADVTPTSSSSPSPSPFASTGRSFLSRLTLPLKSRTRNLADFHIRPDEPYRQYSPGDLVKGAVVLTVVKPIRVTHLTVCLHGFARIFKHPNGANEPLPVDVVNRASTGRRRVQYFGDGYVSLFQDEVTLCGEGRLESGIYNFNFELEFPSKGLPTSIDFERGTISYMITSTITRPTSMAATSSCDKKLSLVETVDIGPMTPPKPRTISLEPISRRMRRRRTVKSKESSSQDASSELGSRTEAKRTAASPHPDESASQCGSTDHSVNRRSPVPSDILSTVSAATGTESTTSSSSEPSFGLGPAPSSAKSKRGSQCDSNSTFADKTITATIELLKSGCLPGDSLPLKISIKHTKAIKSLHGIIITLYRQGRIDSAPPLSLFVDIKGKAAEKMKHDEYYPKSKTGLAGLSLSSAGSSSLFRKDLSQTFAPIIVDPSTLTAVVNASVRVPEDVFPTICGVPGDMISFKYHVEVVVDLGGKLAGQQRHLPRVGMVTHPSNYGNAGGGRGDVQPNMLATWGGSIVDTDQVRREKSVVACLFEVIVGTTDSARKRGRGSRSVRREINDWPEEVPVTPSTRNDPIYEEPSRPNDAEDNGVEQYPHQYHEQSYEDRYPNYYPNDGYNYQQNYDSSNDLYPPPSHTQIPVPPPELEEEEGLDEKERVRRAEERLLPSQPPPDLNDVPSSSRTIIPPSVPSIPDEDDLYSASDAMPPPVSSTTQPPPPSSPFPDALSPFAPALEDLTPHASSTEDKQELERRRLLAEASAPTDFHADEEDDNAGEGSSSAVQLEPSAPILTEDEEEGGYGASYFHHPHHHHTMPGEETLPRYER